MGRRPSAAGHAALFLASALFLFFFSSIQRAQACIPSDGTGTRVTIGQRAYVCLIVNDRKMAIFTLVADTYTRLVLEGSYNATRAVGTEPACEAGGSPNWFPQKCPSSGLVPTSGLGGPPATNFYLSTQGKTSNYKKKYVQQAVGDFDGRVNFWFPIVTAVIQVDKGVVTGVFWDDGCYFCPCDPEGEGCKFTTEDNVDKNFPDLTDPMRCLNNAYNMSNNALLTSFDTPTGLVRSTSGFMGTDCALTADACANNAKTSAGFCDLAVYVVWSGTDSKGHQLSSAGSRFRRFRAYAMSTQVNAMSLFDGNTVTATFDRA